MKELDNFWKDLFNVTNGSADCVEVWELKTIYILFFLVKVINWIYCCLYRDYRLLILRNVNGRQINQMRKNIIKIFKDIGFTIDIETSLKIVDFLDITFNLNIGTYRPYWGIYNCITNILREQKKV